MYQDGPAVGPMLMLCTGSSVNLQLEPIFSNAVWGAGWYNAAESAHYADNAVRYEGSVETELQLGAGGSIWDFLVKWCITERAYGRSFDISPDGARVYQYRTSAAYGVNYDLEGAWNTSLGLSTSQDSFVTASLGLVAIYRDEVNPAGGTGGYDAYSYIRQKTGVNGADCSIFNTTNPLNPGGNNVDPIPYWKTNAQLLTGTWTEPFNGGVVPQTGMETVEWNVDVSQNQTILYTCNGDRLPTAVLMGAMSVSGAVTLYHPEGVFDPILGPNGTGSLLNPYLYAANTWLRVTIAGSANDVYIEVPAAVIESDDYGVKGQNDVTNRAFNLKGMGGRCYNNIAQPPCLMSSSTGGFVAP